MRKLGADLLDDGRIEGYRRRLSHIFAAKQHALHLALIAYTLLIAGALAIWLLNDTCF